MKISSRLITMIVDDIIDECESDPLIAEEMRPLLERLHAVVKKQCRHRWAMGDEGEFAVCLTCGEEDSIDILDLPNE